LVVGLIRSVHNDRNMGVLEVKAKILVADDDALFRELIVDFLQNEGYRVASAADGEEAIEVFFSSEGFDLVILDVMMPLSDGWQVLRAIREHSQVPVIMLTALGDETHEILGLNEGANDYIAKPLSYERFMARVKSQLRKVLQEKKEVLVFKALEIDQGGQTVSLFGEELNFSTKEFKLLSYLLKNCNRVFSREQLLDAVWGYDFYGDPRTVDTHIKVIRSKLQSYGNYIRTVRGMGYIFEVKE